MKKREWRRAEADIRAAIDERRTIRLTPSAADEHVGGIPLALTETFVVMYAFYDFAPGGFRLIPLDNIAAVRAGQFEAVQDGILRAEGLTALAALPDGLDCGYFQTFFDGLRAEQRFAIVETHEQARRSDSFTETFYIGPVVDCSRSNVWLHNFDAAGVWAPALSKIPYRDISLIQYDAPYANVWAKYLPPRPQLPLRRKNPAAD